MRIGKWTTATALALLLSTGSVALAQGHGKGKGHNKHNDDDQDAQFYKDRDREVLRGWYGEHQSQLSSGASRRRIVYRPAWKGNSCGEGRFRRDSRSGLQPCPEELERRLPPPPPDCAHVVIGGSLVLLNRRTNIIVDIFHFESRSRLRGAMGTTLRKKGSAEWTTKRESC